MYYSEWQQDYIINKLLGDKNDGTFVDIGANHYCKNNNSYFFETERNFQGIGIELDSQYAEEWKKRKTPFIVADATTIDYQELFTKYNLPNTIDFLSIDTDPPNISLQCLQKVLQSNYRFNVIDFEVDNVPEIIEASKELLTSKGYILVKEIHIHEGTHHLDDFYVHESFYKEGMENWE